MKVPKEGVHFMPKNKKGYFWQKGALEQKNSIKSCSAASPLKKIIRVPKRGAHSMPKNEKWLFHADRDRPQIKTLLEVKVV